MKNIKEEIMKSFEKNGRAEVFSPIVDSYNRYTHPTPFVWGTDYFVKVVPNPGGNKTLVHFGRRLWKRVGGKWKHYDSYHKIKNKEVNSKKELEFILNSTLFTEFTNSVEW